MRAVSLFSGAGGFELGFDRAGIETLVQVEKDPWCLEVLARHWPDTLRVSDVGSLGLRKVDAPARRGRSRDLARADSCSDAERVRHASGRRSYASRFDLVYGGFPCQDVSVAGARAGFSGERSGLWFEFERVLRDLRPRWAVIENVPGLLSSSQGLDFLRVLMDLDDLGYGIAWRIVDARWFGVPQRRRRVFLVGCSGDAERAAAVLAVCPSCGGHHPTSQGTRKGPTPTPDDSAATLSGGSHGSGVNLPGRHHEDDENLIIARSLTAPGGAGHGGSYRMDDQENLVAGFYSHRGQANDTAWTPDGTSPILSSQQAPGDAGSFGVRRLTPLECERLMGWPDGHTRWTTDGKEISDSHRYRLCGNGVVAPVAEWLGHRLVAADSWAT